MKQGDNSRGWTWRSRWTSGIATLVVIISVLGDAALASGSGDVPSVGDRRPDLGRDQAQTATLDNGRFTWGDTPLDDGARCDVDAVRRANRHQLRLVLDELSNTTFFRLFRVGLEGACPLDIDAKAELQDTPDCAVGGTSSGSSSSEHGLCSVDAAAPGSAAMQLLSSARNGFVDLTITTKESQTFPSASDDSCSADDASLPDFWFDMCSGLVSSSSSPPMGTATAAATAGGWVNLQLNPERHTGYNGSHIWSKVYEAACFLDEECHEERVLHRVLSGLHASINTHIALSFRSKNLVVPNPELFMSSVGSHPDRVRNLNFAFVVLLRALRKASDAMMRISYRISNDPPSDDAPRTLELVQRLVDSHLLSSCATVFEAFDETLMFQGDEPAALKRKFKKAFLEISSLMNCVKCQRCRLHGKLQLAGIGTALKILMLPPQLITPQVLQREELVAFVNTLAKFSSAIAAVDELTEMHLSRNVAAGTTRAAAFVASGESLPPIPISAGSQLDVDLVVAAIADAAFAGALSRDAESALLTRQNLADPLLTSLARHYAPRDPARFAEHAQRLFFSGGDRATMRQSRIGPLVVVVVGTGLAGTTATLDLLDAGAHVVLIEKQGFWGGNSVYASSGMNAVDASARALGDSVEIFARDVAKSSGRGLDWAANPLVRALTEDSESAFIWAQERGRVRFDKLGKLGGHSKARTHRPGRAMAGAELVYSLHHRLRTEGWEANGTLRVRASTKLVGLVVDPTGAVRGVRVRPTSTASNNTLAEETIEADAVVLATGGYAAAPTSSGLISTELARFGTTNGPFASGDGIAVALRDARAAVVDLDKIQLHPTAFAQTTRSGRSLDEELKDRIEGAQPLCAEILRGVGGLLLDAQGHRFCDELGTRAYVSGEMLRLGQADYWILLGEAQAREASHHAPAYERRGLLVRYKGLEDVARAMDLPGGARELARELDAYEAVARTGGSDTFGKSSFANFEGLSKSSYFLLGRVQPARHYCMGGLLVDVDGRVLRERVDDEAERIPGLFAAGEVAGGIHGDNRLGGNGMTEGVVFGRRVVRALIADAAIPSSSRPMSASKETTTNAPMAADKKAPTSPSRIVSTSELARHTSARDCWVAVRGVVYDFSSFLNEHPAGPRAILDVAGTDATKLYEEIHSPSFLEDFVPIGRLENSEATA